MVTGDYVRCTTENCGHKYKIRFNIGNTFPQKGTFKCKTCGKNLTYGWDKQHKKVFEGIDIIEPDDTAMVQNLHPELPIDSLRESDPHYFPSPDFIMQFNKAKGTDFARFRKGQRSMTNFKNKLDDVESNLRYLKEKRWTLLEANYGKNTSVIEKKVLKDVMGVGRLFIEGKWDIMYRDGLSQIEQAKRTANFPALKQYLESRKEDLFIAKLNTVIQLYYKHYHELLPTLLSQKFDIPVNGNSSSADWEKIEMVYGGFYEILGDLMVIPSAVNNLIVRGDFNQFQTVGFDISKYILTDKANRHANFVSNTKLKWIEDFYEAGIRNATYHKASEAENDDQMIVLKTGKGGQTEKRISLIEYISYCNEVFARCMILFNYMYRLLF